MFKCTTNRKQKNKQTKDQNRESFSAICSANQQNFQETKFAHPNVDSIESCPE
jgi:hypothetical protein